MRETPLRRTGSVDDVTALVAFLLSGAAAFITGADIPVDGGLTAHGGGQWGPFRAFHRAGRRSCTLWTHSDTGALDLYLRVGMTVRRSSTVFRKDLRA
ncbi:hypothetical protein GCM10010431_64460 [Streptomyces kunmingensis]